MPTTATWIIEPRAWEDAEGSRVAHGPARRTPTSASAATTTSPAPRPRPRTYAVFLVAIDGGTAPAVRLRADCARSTRLRAEVKRMYVAPGSRGSGAARAVLAALEATARERGWTTLRLETGDDSLQPDANRFYQREGYPRDPPLPVSTSTRRSPSATRSAWPEPG